nr:uncharacterized protein LOC121831594 [Peromyscus maniculatus bairdii]
MTPSALEEELVPTASARSAPPPPKPQRGRGGPCPQENGSARQASLVPCQGPQAQSSRKQHLSVQKPKPRIHQVPPRGSTQDRENQGSNPTAALVLDARADILSLHSDPAGRLPSDQRDHSSTLRVRTGSGVPSVTPGATRWRSGRRGPAAAVSRAQSGQMVFKLWQHQQVHREDLQQRFEETQKPQETVQLYQTHPVEYHSTSLLEHHEPHDLRTPANPKLHPLGSSHNAASRGLHLYP